MGYWSEVRIYSNKRVHDRVLNVIKKFNEKTEYPLEFEVIKATYDEREDYQIVFDWIKWYGYEEPINKIMKTLSDIEGNGKEDDWCAFFRFGESEGDIETIRYGDERCWDYNVTYNIEFDG